LIDQRNSKEYFGSGAAFLRPCDLLCRALLSLILALRFTSISAEQSGDIFAPVSVLDSEVGLEVGETVRFELIRADVEVLNAKRRC
jgi:hypothetical protein